MANLDRPRGFAPHGKVLRSRPYEAGSACYPGDLVALASDGQVDPAATGAEILGLCLTYASAAGQEVLVADHPDQLISGQADETELDAQTDVGNMCDIVATAGDSTYKTSRQEVDSSTVVATTAQLQILGIERRPNNALGTNVEVVCRINEHQFGDTNAGV
jgi:hypothetical protein